MLKLLICLALLSLVANFFIRRENRDIGRHHSSYQLGWKDLRYYLRLRLWQWWELFQIGEEKSSFKE